jgi:hypothetical protein
LLPKSICPLLAARMELDRPGCLGHCAIIILLSHEAVESQMELALQPGYVGHPWSPFDGGTVSAKTGATPAEPEEPQT